MESATEKDRDKKKEDKDKKDKEWHDLVRAVGAKCDWSYDNIISFVSDLLQDSNFHTARKYIVRFMTSKDW